MNGPMRKDLFRSIKKSLTRFISIVAIIALGISFFVGMKSASPDMNKTANEYFIKNNLMDIEVYSTIGFTSEEIKQISAVDGIHAAEGVKYADTLVFSGENGIMNATNGAAMACRVMSLDFEAAEKFCETGEADDSYINRVELIDGKFPENKNECVVDCEASKSYAELAIGNVITLNGDGTTLSDTLKSVNYKIVGTVSSPAYISFERGTTSIASGTLGMYMYISEDRFVQKEYTSAFAIIENKSDYDVYSEKYKEDVRKAADLIEKLSSKSINHRLADVKAEYTQKIKDGQKKYDKLEAQTTAQLEAALKKINDIQDYIDNGGNDIAADKKALESRVAAAKDNLDASKERYNSSKEAYDKDTASARDKGNQLTGSAKAKQIYNDYVAKQKKDRAEIDALYTTAESYRTERSAAKSRWDSAERNYQNANNNCTNKENELKSAQETLDKYKKQKAAWTEESGISLEVINANIREYNLKCTRISNELDVLKSNRSQADTARSEAKKDYEDACRKCDKIEITIQEREATYAKNQVVLNGYADDIKRLQEGEEALTIFKNQLSQAEKNLIASKIAITESQLRLYYEESTGNQKLTAEEANLKAAKTRLETAEKEYSDIEHDVKLSLENAQGDIDKAQLFLDELNKSVWLVRFQDELPGHESYGQSLENINAIANVFPVFFYIIAAFMCLATMTRMVQEERMQLGTLKALGYGNLKMLLKYYYYAALACLTGSAVGAAAGSFIFPKAIDSAYSMMYHLPSVKLSINWIYIFLGTLFALAITLAATRIACSSELKVQAAHLMRPKSPVPGKRIFLERFETLWNKMSFGSIVTLRNMFRSKRRMVMTIVGVACCTTLILSAFGLSNSVDKIITAQYEDNKITKYDLMVSLDEAQNSAESEIFTRVKEDVRVKDGMFVITKTMTAYSADDSNDTEMTAHIIVPEKPEKISDFISLRNRKNGSAISLGDDGAVISEKLSKDTGTSVGDEIILRDSRGDEFSVPVTAVTENYLEHYVYLSPVCYKEAVGESPEFKNLMLTLENFTASGDEQNLADDLFTFKSVIGVSSSDIIIESFNAVIDRLDTVIIIFIVAAGLLALIILYNLTNISVQERLREIATIKVLGFTDSEVTSYVYRENIFMTVAGILLGLPLGSLLHKAVINIAEVNVAMFGREIYWWSYLLASLITAIFAAAVCVLVHKRLQTLDTVSSLKSVE